MRTSMKNYFLFTISLLVIALCIGCEFDETEKANKLVDAANTAIKEANDKNTHGTNRLLEVEKAIPNLSNESDLERTRSAAKDVITDLEKARDNYKEAGNRFAEASKLNVKDKFKEYLELKGKEMSKRGELMDALLDEPKALIDSNGPDEYKRRVGKVVDKVTGLRKDSEDLESKADKIFAENKDLFKQDAGK